MTDAFVQQPPLDSISQVRYSPTNPHQLLASAWDATVRLYEGTAQKAKFDHRAAVLSCCFGDATNAYSGGLDCTVRHLGLDTEKTTNIGTHDDSISSLVWSKDKSWCHALITGSWDQSIRFWDARAPTAHQLTEKVPERVYFMDNVNNTLVVAMASRLIRIYDERNMSKPQYERESSLKYLTRSLACMADGQGYAMASTEGRIAVEYFDPSPAVQEKKYAFKCHRQTIEGVDHVWPVNALAFHPIHNTFSSAGSDGQVSVWDHKVKKRLKQYPKYESPVSSMAFNCDGTSLAVATSYTWDEGEEGARRSKPPAIALKQLGDEMKVRRL
ncbi:WD40 repeat-like protein [Cylindrobasidium torrendii FP15055 ss-10]|uniref:WD40 repeat-like protein n=1 Tax=Cylindrobasidium torrendii FP15055 ss-10 TaxID=1314674 RepID=A0A0D7B8C6_9AGAR|nr:WD40 repeat-like protein [Cylindrobasidium torrendii FP15055 ss-10]